MSMMEPILRRKFQWTDFETNKNRWWLVEVWPNGTFTTTWGRVDRTPQSKTKHGGVEAAMALIRQKLEKGYNEVDLHIPGISAAKGPAGPLGEIVEDIFLEAGEYIKGYLSVGVNELSQAQIRKGREILDKVQRSWTAYQLGGPWRDVVWNVQAFYNAIPTRLPHRIDPNDVTRRFVSNLSEMEDRLNQLEAAVAMVKAQAGGAVSNLTALGAELDFLPQTDPMYERITDYVRRTQVHGYTIRVRDILTVKIPLEREAFEQETFSKSSVQLLWHGTRGANVRHILRTGLIIPRMAANGSMFGRGLYFANKVSKSANYSSTNRLPYRFLFLADVALGNPFVPRDENGRLTRAPDGYHSVWGKAGHTLSWGGPGTLRFDEFVVYRTSQQTIRYLVTC